MPKFFGYWDSKLKMLVEGHPPQFKKFGQGPIFINDVMPPTKHGASGEVIESRRQWNATDQAYNTETVGSKKELKARVSISEQDKKRAKKVISQDRKQSYVTAQKEIDSGRKKLAKKEHPEFINNMISGAISNGTGK